MIYSINYFTREILEHKSLRGAARDLDMAVAQIHRGLHNESLIGVLGKSEMYYISDNPDTLKNRW